MFPRVAALEPMDHDPQRFEINVFDSQHSDLAGSQTMAVSKQKDCFFTPVRCESMKQARSLLQREKLDRICAHRCHSRITPSPTIRPTSDALRNAWPIFKTPRAPRPPKRSFRTEYAWSITARNNRLQIFFPEIPSEAIRGELKSNGFRWSPTLGAWQRHRSNRATYLAKLMLANRTP